MARWVTDICRHLLFAQWAILFTLEIRRHLVRPLLLLNCTSAFFCAAIFSRTKANLCIFATRMLYVLNHNYVTICNLVLRSLHIVKPSSQPSIKLHSAFLSLQLSQFVAVHALWSLNASIPYHAVCWSDGSLSSTLSCWCRCIRHLLATFSPSIVSQTGPGNIHYELRGS